MQWGLWHLTPFSEWPFKMLLSLPLWFLWTSSTHCREAKQCEGANEQEKWQSAPSALLSVYSWSCNMGHCVEQLLHLLAHKAQMRTSSVCSTPRISLRVAQAPFTHCRGWSMTFSPSLCPNSKGKHFTSVKFIYNKNILKQLLRTLFCIFYTSCWTTWWRKLNSIKYSILWSWTVSLI